MSQAPVQRLYSKLAGLIEGKLWVRVLLGLVLGTATGALLGPTGGLVSSEAARNITNWLALPGDLFIRLVQMVMIPLVVASIIQGIAGEGKQDRLARLGARVTLYFVGTTVVAILVGLGAALSIQPGRLASLSALAEGTTSAAPTAAQKPVDVPSLISGLLPSNPLASVLAGELLSIVIFSVIVGAALVSMSRERAEPVLKLMFSVQEICMTVTKWAMRLAPFAVFGLMARTTARSGLSAITALGLYVVTVLAALAVIFVLYGLLIALLTPVRVSHWLRSSSDALLLAFSVASSAAVMPVTLKTAEERLDVPTDVARFIVPVGAILNMNGTAAYQAVATVFLAQVYGMEMGLANLALIVVTTVAASVGTPSAPGAGIVVLATVLASAGVPVEGVAIILGVDHLLGMCRTSVNVAGDLTACVVFSGSGAADLAAAPQVQVQPPK